ncbi:acetyltransferase [Zunongwangia sp. H14]|uniref:acetyltransferase n=1 Tax=Zunongwangia sp. H14 TaxID=3240792 RepID=UPI0035695249
MNIYGASGHARVILDILKSTNTEVHYIFDDDKDICKIGGYPVAHEWSSKMLKHPTLIAIGENQVRKKVVNNFKGEIAPPLAHRSSIISDSAVLKAGTVVMANAVINSEAHIGKHCIVNTAAVIEHEVVLGNYVHISPGAILTGNVKIGEGAHIGAGVSVIPGVHIGKWAIIGAGAVVINDIPDFAVVVGNPGRIIKNRRV